MSAPQDVLGDFTAFHANSPQMSSSLLGVADTTPATPVITNQLNPFDSHFISRPSYLVTQTSALSSAAATSRSTTTSGQQQQAIPLRHPVAQPPSSSSSSSAVTNGAVASSTKKERRHQQKQAKLERSGELSAGGGVRRSVKIEGSQPSNEEGGKKKGHHGGGTGVVAQNPTNVLKVSSSKVRKVRPYPKPASSSSSSGGPTSSLFEVDRKDLNATPPLQQQQQQQQQTKPTKSKKSHSQSASSISASLSEVLSSTSSSASHAKPPSLTSDSSMPTLPSTSSSHKPHGRKPHSSSSLHNPHPSSLHHPHRDSPSSVVVSLRRSESGTEILPLPQGQKVTTEGSKVSTEGSKSTTVGSGVGAIAASSLVADGDGGSVRPPGRKREKKKKRVRKEARPSAVEEGTTEVNVISKSEPSQTAQSIETSHFPAVSSHMTSAFQTVSPAPVAPTPAGHMIRPQGHVTDPLPVDPTVKAKTSLLKHRPGNLDLVWCVWGIFLHLGAIFYLDCVF